MDGQTWLATVFEPALERDSLADPRNAGLLRGQLAALHECGVVDAQAHSNALRPSPARQRCTAT